MQQRRKELARFKHRYNISSTIVKTKRFYVQKQQTEWAYQYKKSSVIVKTNWIYVQNRQAE